MPELYPEDQQRVKEYLSASQHQVVRKPFRPMLLLLALFVILGILTVVALVIAQDHGVM